MRRGMANWLTTALLDIEQNICGAEGPLLPEGHHGLIGPVLGNLLVVALAGSVALACIALALRMVIWPGEQNPEHPKYRILSADH
jgi:hypothetical protein